jgi:hypothetical protein
LQHNIKTAGFFSQGFNMIKDRFGQDLRAGALVVTACSAYSGTGRLEVGVIKKVDVDVRPNYYSNGADRISGKVHITKLTWYAGSETLTGTLRAENMHEKTSLMTNNQGMIIIQGPDCFTAQFPIMLRERILFLMGEYTR